MAWWLPVWGLWRREMVRFLRQRSRLTGAILQPLVFWALLGGGLSASFRPAGAPAGMSYLTYFYPGTIVLVLLFTAIFATISTVEDRKSGFLQGVLVAPVPRTVLTLGQALGSTTLAVLQGALMLVFAPALGIALSVTVLLSSLGVMAMVALALSSLGLTIAWRMDSTQGFHAVMNLLLLPLWFLSGAFFPLSGAPLPIRWLMQANPLTYGVALLRYSLYLDAEVSLSGLPSPAVALVITSTFAMLAFSVAVRAARRRVL